MRDENENRARLSVVGFPCAFPEAARRARKNLRAKSVAHSISINSPARTRLSIFFQCFKTYECMYDTFAVVCCSG